MVVDWPEGKVPVIVIEPKEFFRHLVKDLSNQSDGDVGPFVLSDNWEPVDISKNMMVITDPLMSSINDKKLQTALQRWLSRQAVNEHNFVSTREILHQVQTWAMIICEESEEALTMESEPDVTQLLKMCNIRFEEEDDNLPDLLLKKMRVVQSYLGISCFAFVGLKECLTREELLELYRIARYRNINIMLLESIQPEIIHDVETLWLIDQDYCEIFPDAL